MQVTISHLRGSLQGSTQRFERESVLIGRGQENDVTLDPFLDPTVSAQHAEIRVEGQDIMLYDMGSLNGTYLNGCNVRRARLKKGDEIALGRRGPLIQFHFDRPGAEAPESATSPFFADPRQVRLHDTTREPIVAPTETVIRIRLLAWLLVLAAVLAGGYVLWS